MFKKPTGILTVALLCGLLILLSFKTETNQNGLTNFFLGLKYNSSIRQLYTEISVRSDFDQLTDSTTFSKSARFKAKYTGKSELYPDADSVSIYVVTCSSLGTFFTAGAKNCVSVTVFCYLKDSAMVRRNYMRLDSLISTQLRDDNPEWKNHKGATRGAYFLSENLYPYVILNKSNYKGHYVSIDYIFYEE